MELNWGKLRPYNDSLNSAFEELCCQLAGSEVIPSGAKFIRKGTPDAGVECFWKLSNGDEYAWQAKFFRSSGEIDWDQMDRSIDTALEKHPDLKKYIFCLPMDRPDARIDDRMSCLEKWNERVDKWKTQADEKGMTVDYEYWGQHEIGTRLALDKHSGRRFFWFNEEYLSQKWLEGNLEIAIKNAGTRYTPELNVDVPISKTFDALGRSDEYKEKLKYSIGRLNKSYKRGSSATVSEYAQKELEELNGNLQQCKNNMHALSESPLTIWNIEDAEENCKAALNSIDNLRRKLEESEKELKSKTEDDSGDIVAKKQDFSYELHNLRELEIAFYDLSHSIKDPSFQVANRPSLLVLGNAGTGKTHLFCDVANKRIASGLVTVLLLGQHFTSGNPWSQIISQLALPNSTTRDTLLGALEAAAQTSGNRALIMIDALNESEDRRIWLNNLAGILAVLRNFPWIGVAISIRKSYQDVVIPNNLIGNKITLIEHRGFVDCGYEAIKKFFEHYHIQLPSVPFLEPEFYNPLFLKIFCEGLHKKGESRIPPGLKGITNVFDFFLDAINEKLGRDSERYDVNLKLVQKTAYKVAEKMAEDSVEWLLYNDTDELLKSIWPQETHTLLPLRALISEGLFSEDRFLTPSGDWQEGIKFCYQRFSDHMITHYLLKSYGNRKSLAVNVATSKNIISVILKKIAREYNRFRLKRAFRLEKALGKFIKDEYSCWRYSGLIEAFSVQIPEFIGCEFVVLAPNISGYDFVNKSFVNSLLWRNPTYISKRTLEYINSYIIYSHSHDQFLEALLTVAPLPYHPYNADFLHKHLMKQGLAKRDSWWSTFLYDQYGEKGPLDRLIDWCWSREDKQHISDDSVKLCAKSLCWFFTTSQRSIRDRATKALVALLRNRIHIMKQLLHEFNKVDDPYVLERLYASAYGCAMKSKNKEGVIELAVDTYNLIFEEGTPPVNISLRGYARCLVELGLCYDSDLDVDVNKVRPPYHSEWTENITAVADVKSIYQIPYHDKMTDEEWGQDSIIFSVLDNDFARYIIGTNFGHSNWSSRRLGVPREPTNREIHEAFLENLNQVQKEKLKEYKEALIQSIRIKLPLNIDRLILPSEEQIETNSVDIEDASKEQEDAKEVERKKDEFLATLDSSQIEIFNSKIDNFVEDSRLLHERDYFDLSIAQAFILERVFSLGWNKELHGQFDCRVSRYGPISRTSHKPERIGKKYQWIAYRELLARVSDNFEYVGGITGEDREYIGTWQLSHSRDIDPSCVLKKTGHEGWGVHEKTWWFPYEYIAWEEPEDDVKWLKETDDLPDFSTIIKVPGRENNEWITLEGFYNLEQPAPPEEDKYELERRTMWFSVKSYIVKKGDIDKIYEWAKRQDFWGDWMPKSYDVDVFLGEYFWSPAFKYFQDPYYGQSGWGKGDAERRGIPCDILITTTSYSSEMSGYDCSIDEGFRICTPAQEIVSKMNLNWSGYGGKWLDAKGDLIAFDPSVHEKGPGCMLIRKNSLLKYLNENGYDIIWTIIGAKRMLGGSMSSRYSFKGELKINGVARLQNGDLFPNIHYDFQNPNQPK